MKRSNYKEQLQCPKRRSTLHGYHGELEEGTIEEMSLQTFHKNTQWRPYYGRVFQYGRCNRPEYIPVQTIPPAIHTMDRGYTQGWS